MQLYFKIDQYDGRGRYVAIKNQKFINNVIDCFPDVSGKIIKHLKELNVSSCCACLSAKKFVCQGKSSNLILVVGILNVNRVEEGYSLNIDNVAYRAQ